MYSAVRANPCSSVTRGRQPVSLRGLARAVGVERPADGDRKTERLLEAQRELVGPDLGRRVRRLPLERMLLGDRNELGGSVDLGGRGLDETAHAPAAAGFQDVERA